MLWTATVSLDAFPEFQYREGQHDFGSGSGYSRNLSLEYFSPLPTDKKFHGCVCVSPRGSRTQKSLACVAIVIKMAITDSAGDHVLPKWRTLI